MSSAVDVKYFESIMVDMESIGIKCALLKKDHMPSKALDDKRKNHEDFLIFGEENIFTRWIIDPNHRKVIGTQTRIIDTADDYDFRQVKMSWNSLVRDVQSVEYDADDYFTDDIRRISKEFQSCIGNGDVMLDTSLRAS